MYSDEVTAEEIGISEADMAWRNAYTMPPKINMYKNASDEQFVLWGTQVFQLMERLILEHHPGKPIETLDILDFGCGIGRVIMPFYHKYKRPNAACDILPANIRYLSSEIPGCNPVKTELDPPLPYADNSFDVIYAVSVWTHMNLETGRNWLHEMKRILKPGGVALLTTSGYKVLAIHRDHPERGQHWKHFSDDDLASQGYLFVPRDYGSLNQPYGEIVYDLDWLKKDWSTVMPVIDQLEHAVYPDGRQDMNVLKKPD